MSARRAGGRPREQGCPESPPRTELGRGRKTERNKASIKCLWLQDAMLVMVITA